MRERMQEQESARLGADARRVPRTHPHEAMQNFQVSKPCSQQPRLSFVSRGVRSRPPEEGGSSAKVDTIPLLSPSMESELLKEPWVFPRVKMDSPKLEDPTVFPVWEENFQDLSSWCMDTGSLVQGQCDFRLGESTPFKLSGTKYEGNGASTSEEIILEDFTSLTDDKKWSLKMDTTPTLEHANGRCHPLQQQKFQPAEGGFKEEPDDVKCGASNSWLKLPRDASLAAEGASWSKLNGTDVSAPFQPGYRIGNLDLDDDCPTSFDSAENQRESWDVLHTVETTGSDTFDLLSYLCDDEMRSAVGSTSATPGTTTRSSRSAKSSVMKLRSLKTAVTGMGKANRASSTVTSSSEPAAMPVRRSGRTRTQSVKSVESDVLSPAAERRDAHRQGRKRCIDSDSDDRMSNSSYRESREKNNEASRKSRMNKKAKENEMAQKAVELERDNRILKMKVEELEKLVTSMRNALLRSALRKEL